MTISERFALWLTNRRRARRGRPPWTQADIERMRQHPFGSVCPHGVQMLDECEECK